MSFQATNLESIINLSSAAQVEVNLAALQGKEKLDVSTSYAQSKMALTTWTFFLANAQSNKTIISVNLGSFLNTKMVQEAYGFHRSPVSKGADIVFKASTSKEFKESSGQYFDNDLGGFSRAISQVYDSIFFKELKTVTDQILVQFK